MTKKVLFINRNEIIASNLPIDGIEKLVFRPYAISSLSKIAKELDYELVMVSYQNTLGTVSSSEATLNAVHNFITTIFKNEGVAFTDVFIEGEKRDNKMLQTTIFGKYIYGNYDLKNAYFIGNPKTDLQLAEELGAQSILISDGATSNAAYTATDWLQIYQYLKRVPMIGKVHRKTLETDINIEVNLSGSGQSSINTGIAFFDHMLQQISKHGNFDLTIQVKGDLEIDEHHTIEDTAIALGEAILQALGSKKGIERYGFLLPMDDCLAQVAVDFGGRPWLVWDITFKREKIGDVPTEMFFHFFKSFSDYAKCNLNIKAEGENEHHKIESVFKAFAKAVKMAVSKTENFNIPSTKGSL